MRSGWPQQAMTGRMQSIMLFRTGIHMETQSQFYAKGLEETLAAMADERDDLTQRIRFLERQLTKAREERGRAVSWDHAATQTEAEVSIVMSPLGQAYSWTPRHRRRSVISCIEHAHGTAHTLAGYTCLLSCPAPL
eukprot:3083635-Pyramimonas_sp.AAC.1